MFTLILTQASLWNQRRTHKHFHTRAGANICRGIPDRQKRKHFHIYFLAFDYLKASRWHNFAITQFTLHAHSSWSSSIIKRKYKSQQEVQPVNWDGMRQGWTSKWFFLCESRTTSSLLCCTCCTHSDVISALESYFYCNSDTKLQHNQWLMFKSY